MIGGASLASASTSYTFNSLGYAAPNVQNGITGSGGSPLGPYTGTLGGQTVALYCDDFNTHVSPGDSYTVNTTLVSSILASPSSYTNTVRFDGTASKDGIALPSGTNIYQEVAWLLTQETHYVQPSGSSNQAGTVQDAIQDAIWSLTESDSASTSNANYHANVSGSSNSALNPYLWATLAANSTNLNAVSNSSYTTATGGITLYAADYTTWEVIDQSNSFLNAANGGVGGTGQYQEMLTQVASAGGSGSGSGSATPEPGTFLLLGGALAAVGFRKFRKA